MSAVKLSPIPTPDKNLQLIQDNVNKALTALQAAGGMPYDPGKPGNWAAPAPTTLQGALDRMAALLVTLNSGGAIP